MSKPTPTHADRALFGRLTGAAKPPSQETLDPSSASPAAASSDGPAAASSSSSAAASLDSPAAASDSQATKPPASKSKPPAKAAHKPVLADHKALSVPDSAQVLDARALKLTKSKLPNSIVTTISKLKDAGFQAYIVGGGVRDQLLGLDPKDFDAVTNATPDQVQKVFGRQCKIIGRRFLLAHVRFGREIIEVATFRAPPAAKSAVAASGMITRDNVWGSIEQDFARRDFTINSLYYDPIDEVVLDFCGAIEDIKNKHIHFLGETQVRIDEDPVRLLRALRFSAKLGFSLCEEVQAAFTKANWEHLKSVSAHRLFDETLKIFGSGKAAAALPLLKKYGAQSHLLVHPENTFTPLVEAVAKNTDERIGLGKSINPAFFYCALLWPAYQSRLELLTDEHPLVEAMDKASIHVINMQRQVTAMPRYAEQFIREVWALQPRLERPKPKHVASMTEQPRFRAAFDFLLLRERSGEATFGMGEFWETYQEAGGNERESMIRAYSKTYSKLKQTAGNKPAKVKTPEPAVQLVSEAAGGRRRPKAIDS